MISQKHEDGMPQGEQISTPVEETFTPAAREGRSRQVPSSLRWWAVALLCIPGVALPLAAGLLVWKPSPLGLDIYGLILANAALVALGAFSLGFALRTWWGVLYAALIASAAWFGGQFQSAVAVSPAVNGDFWIGQRGELTSDLLLIFLVAGSCAWAGIALRKRWWEKRRQRQ